MSETINQSFVIQKTTPNSVLFTITSIDNQQTTEVFLTEKQPTRALPHGFAMAVFFDQGVYELYKQGCFTFRDNAAAVKAAQEAGVYFSDELDFEPAKPETPAVILSTLKLGQRKAIEKCIESYGKTPVVGVATAHVQELTMNVIEMLEEMLNIQLTLNKDE